MKSKKLRVIIDSLVIGGAERRLSLILPVLKNRGWDITILTIYPNNNSIFYSVMQNAGIKVISPKQSSAKKHSRSYWTSIVNYLHTLANIYKSFRQEKTAITFFVLPRSYIIGMIVALLARNKGPKIMNRCILNNYSQNHPIAFKVEKFLHKKMNFVITNSEASAYELNQKEGLPLHKIKLIYNGTDLNIVANISKQNIRKSLNISTNSLVFITVANLVHYKGHKDLINALDIIKNKLPTDWTLLCIGRDMGMKQKLNTLLSLKKLQNNILLLGQKKDVPNYLNCADIYISSSHAEGFSNAILEAIRAKLPIVATNIGGNREIIKNNINGLLAHAEQPKDLARAILKMSQNPDLRKTFAKRSYKLIEQEFSLNQCISKYEKIFNSLV